jgi:hypothetical protein
VTARAVDAQAELSSALQPMVTVDATPLHSATPRSQNNADPDFQRISITYGSIPWQT